MQGRVRSGMNGRIRSCKSLSGALLESTGLCVAIGSIAFGHSVLARARACTVCAPTRPVLLSVMSDRHLAVGVECFDHWDRVAHVQSGDTWRRSYDRTLARLCLVNLFSGLIGSQQLYFMGSPV
jgi:hypothetical protein